METKTVDVQDAQSNLKELLSLVDTGTEIVLTVDSKPVARLVSIKLPSAPRVAGLHQGSMWIGEDFDEPLPEVFWTGDK
jgi:prevent-host-death family protein